jgi:RNA polymerase sigma-70 factor, ECF subfamily
MAHQQHLEALADEDLLRNIGEGCTECFALLFHRYCRQVFSVSFRILRDRAETEDVLQEVFLSVYQHQERFDRSRGTVRTWILQFAYYKALLRRRYLKIRDFYRQEEMCEARDARRAQSPDLLGMSLSEWTHYVEAGIGSLSLRQRRVLELVHFEGHTLQESAEILRETLANTRNHYYRGLKALRAFLGAREAQAPAHSSAAFERNDGYGFETSTPK